MTGLIQTNNTATVERAKREWGEKSFPIWLIINPKHPVVRQYIWTLVLAEIQEKIYQELQTRIESKNIYIRNAVSDSRIVPNTVNWWDAELTREITQYRELVMAYQPSIIISFGAFPFEFLRRVYQMKPEKGPKYWCTGSLGEEFDHSIEHFDVTKTNKIPLLRRVVESDKFIEDHAEFKNYYHYVGTKIAEKLIENKDQLKIWIK